MACYNTLTDKLTDVRCTCVYGPRSRTHDWHEHDAFSLRLHTRERNGNRIWGSGTSKSGDWSGGCRNRPERFRGFLLYNFALNVDMLWYCITMVAHMHDAFSAIAERLVQLCAFLDVINISNHIFAVFLVLFLCSVILLSRKSFDQTDQMSSALNPIIALQ